MRFLRGRWNLELVSKAVADCQAGRVLSPFGLVSETGMVDLRGFPVDRLLEYLTVERVDLSASLTVRGGQFGDVTAVDSRFDRSDWTTNLGGSFERCSFRRARLSCGFPSRSRFQECDFSEANLSKARGGLITFVRCNFMNVTMRGTSLLGCVFDECNWDGVRFFHATLGKSRITERGFPKESGSEEEGRILPDVILGGVTWT